LKKERSDGVPSIDNSSNRLKPGHLSTSKFLLNEDDEIEKLSNISEMFERNDDQKFMKMYNI
jgi:hypothetical protein